MMKFFLMAVLIWCGAVCVPAHEYPFPAEREWISKLGDVMKGSFQSCSETRVAIKAARKRVEIPLNRLDEEDAALIRFLATPEGRRDFKLAETLWPFIMKELEKVTWSSVERDITSRYDAAARKAPPKTVSSMRNVDGFACTSSLSTLPGPPFRLIDGYRVRTRPESGRGQKNVDVVLDNGILCADYDAGKGVLTPDEDLPRERTEMRSPVSSLLLRGEQVAAHETKWYSNVDYSLLGDRLPVKGPYETCRPGSLGKKELALYWNTEGKMVCGVMKLEYDNAGIVALFDDRRKLMNAPGLGYAVIVSRMSKKSRDPKIRDERYYHVALAADGLPVSHYEGRENDAAMDPLNDENLRESEKKAALAEEGKREQAVRARQEARKRLVESAGKRRA